jgi:lipopolysaccharide biosynthesis protein
MPKENDRGRVRFVALYLPQYHPVPENDEWWGKGFTEWTNVAKARPLFRGHYQPHVPADLGFYDLRVPESRIAQAEMARSHGIEAFCYYHYWFAGRRLLERPFNEVLASGEPDFPFCLSWANQTWTGVWYGAPKHVLIEQTYPGEDDHRRHFETLLPAFLDRRYVRVDGKPLFVVYNPMDIPELQRFTDLFRELAAKAGLPGLHLVGESWYGQWFPREHGFDAVVTSNLPSRRRDWTPWREPIRKIRQKTEAMRNLPTVYRYKDLLDSFVRPGPPQVETYPCLVPNWDNSPRSGANGLVMVGSTPELFRRQVRRALEVTQDLPAEHRLIFVKSWNEWAEGNHLEPDLKFGRAYLEVLRDEVASGGDLL